MNFKTCDVNYEKVGSGECELVFLHGWGGEIDSFKFICKYLKNEYRALFIDFPPFGKSTEMQKPWTIFDYAELVLEIMRKEKIKKPILIGHSFGGKISLLYASKYEVEKLVLFGSPFRKEIEKESLKLKSLDCVQEKLLIR